MNKPFLILVPLFFSLLWVGSASCQTVQGVVVDDSWHSPVQGILITLGSENAGSWSTTSDSAGLFRIDSVPTGDYRLKIEYHCFRALNRGLSVPPGSSVVDLGLLIIEHARPRLKLDHDMCQATKEEDSETRLLLEVVAADSTWRAFADRHPGQKAPVSSVWLKWGSSVSLFGAEREVLSPLDTGTSGLVSATDHRTHDGPFFVVTHDPTGDFAVLTVGAARGPWDFSETVLATFRRSLAGWELVAVLTMEPRGGRKDDTGGGRSVRGRHPITRCYRDPVKVRMEGGGRCWTCRRAPLPVGTAAGV